MKQATSPEYMVTRRVYERLEEITKIAEKAKVENDDIIRQAIDIGDLSENATYAVAVNRREMINKILSINKPYMEECSIATLEEMSSAGYPNLYKVFNLKITDAELRKNYIAEYLLTPSIDLDLSIDQLWISSDVGRSIVSQSVKSTWSKVKGKFIKVEVLGIRDMTEEDFKC